MTDPRICVFCKAPWTDEMMADLTLELTKRLPKVVIECASCKQTVLTREVPDQDA